MEVSASWTVAEVNAWLRDRNLTEQQCKEFDGFDGRDILSLGREDFEPVVGRLKATALYNQLHPDTKESTSAREAEADQGGSEGHGMPDGSAEEASQAKRRRVEGGEGLRRPPPPPDVLAVVSEMHSKLAGRGPVPTPEEEEEMERARRERGRPGTALDAGPRPYNHIDCTTLRVIRHHELYVPRQRTRELVSDRHSTRERLPEGAYDDHDSPSFDDRRRRSGDQFDDSADSPPPPPPRTPPRRSIDEEALDYSE